MKVKVMNNSNIEVEVMNPFDRRMMAISPKRSIELDVYTKEAFEFLRYQYRDFGVTAVLVNESKEKPKTKVIQVPDINISTGGETVKLKEVKIEVEEKPKTDISTVEREAESKMETTEQKPKPKPRKKVTL